MSVDTDARVAQRPSLAGIALAFAGMSATSFGGGQKASIRRQVIERGWMDREVFMDGLELAQVLPGPNILNLAIYCGQKVRGLPGAIAAFLGVSLPTFVIILIAGALYFRFAANPYVHGALKGCAVGALGLTLGNALELSWDERRDWIRMLLLIVTGIVVAMFKMPLLLVLVVFGGIGVLHEYLRSRARPESKA
ncbi:MAG: chromate transporter [Candidatus Eremiobacteraeota bacterium]|nr:chromate transporter [Candidatus Eremiobacteraeota bacterium]